MTSIAIVQQISLEPAGFFEELIQKAGFDYHYIRPFQGDVIPKPNQINNYAGYIFLGGPMSVNDQKDCPYLTDEILLIQEALGQQKPVLGICLGAQLIAAAAGQSIYKKELEIGWAPLQLNETHCLKDPLFSSLPSSLNVFHWHSETFDLPPQAHHLASSVLFKNQAFSINNHAYGLQFHLEMTEPLIQEWLQHAEEQGLSLSLDQKKEMIQTAKTELPTLHKQAAEFFNGFLNLMTL